jgi:hypothetical protein
MPNVYALGLALVALAFVLRARFDQQRRRTLLLTSTLLVLSVFSAAFGSTSSRPTAQTSQ